MNRIFIPRSVAETSMPYVVDCVQDFFGPDISIHIITRPENAAIMAEIRGVADVYSVDTLFFSKESKILKLDTIHSKDIIVMPITNLKALNSYTNVIKFIQSNFKGNNIYFHDFDNLQISKYYEKGAIKKILSFVYGCVASLLTLILICIFIISSIFKVIFIRKKKGDFLLKK